MNKIIDGRALAEKINDETVRQIVKLNGLRPNLAIILVGEREDSKLYVSLKEKTAKKVGIDTHLYKFTEKTTDADILETLNFLNNDNLIDGILVQLPLPDNLDTDGIILAIDKNKDIDGFHPDNLENLFKHERMSAIMPPVFGAVLEILKSIDFELAGKKFCIIANSEIFGKSLAKFLNINGGQTEFARADDSDLISKSILADVVITAVGRAHYVKKDMIKNQAVLIDVGICREGGKVCGDIDFEDVKDKASFITPVPGGIGPLTIAMAFKNTLDLYKRKK